MKTALAVGGIIAAFILSFVLVAVLMFANGPQSGRCAGPFDTTKIAPDAQLQITGSGVYDGTYPAARLTNAAHIANAATALGLDATAQQLGIMTALGESTLDNITYGDWETSGVTNPNGTPTSSIGLFQQQEWWGSAKDRLDPFAAATLFYEALLGVENWQGLEPSYAAHLVQGNLVWDHYTQAWPVAGQVLDWLNQNAAGGVQCGTGSGEAVYPLAQPYMMTDNFGPRISPTAGASSWHPAIDLVGQCGDPIYSVMEGVVTESSGYTLSIQHPDGFTISYLHAPSETHLVRVGDHVTAGQHIAPVGNAGPSTGCHLDLRISAAENRNPLVAALPLDPSAPTYVNPEEFFPQFGINICPPEWCSRNYSD